MLSVLDEPLPATAEGRRRALATILATGYLRLRTCAGARRTDSSGSGQVVPAGESRLDDVKPASLHGDQTVSDREIPEEERP